MLAKSNLITTFYTSTKSWRGYIFTAVCLCVCLCVCVSVCPILCRCKKRKYNVLIYIRVLSPYLATKALRD